MKKAGRESIGASLPPAEDMEREVRAEVIMTPEQVEEKVIELIHREPFVPFVVEMNDGTS
jgi:hypothetical protein